MLETVGSIEDFIRAVQRIEGLEYLGEFDEEDIPPDDDFYIEDSPQRSLRGTIYLMMTNQQAMEQLLSLWRQYIEDPEVQFEWGLGRFKRLFQLLRDIRPWGAEDRIRETGVLDDWQQRIAAGNETVPAEVELWYRGQETTRRAAETEVRRFVQDAAGQVVGSALIPEIRYHALLAQLPIASVQPLFEDVAAVELVRSDRVMFLRPTGQTVLTAGSDEGREYGPFEESEELSEPIVALLDGVPLERHEALTGRLDIDDPDGYSADAPANRRRHGTAMSSLIVHGDLEGPGRPLASRLYVRPILTPGPAWVHNAPEQVPDDVLTVDLIHRAVSRMFDDGVADSVRVINLSVGDRSAPFTRMLSSWARLLDWISWHYEVLVVVSSGNHPGNIALEVGRDTIEDLSTEELQAETLKSLTAQGGLRRLLPPAESVNALTVGASPQDEAVFTADERRRELITSPWVSAPFSALGLGFRRSIKPDVLMPGGRSIYQLTPASDGSSGSTFVEINQPHSPPGQLVASPVGPTGGLRSAQYWRGTSNAAALASRTAAQLSDVLEDLRSQPGGDFLNDQGIFAAALKALLVHGAQHGEGLSLLSEAVRGQVDARKIREFVCRFIGYGLVDPQLVFGSSARRVTMLGGNRIPAEEADVFQIPLPPGLSGRTGQRRLKLTLAWLTPINSRDRRYRRSRLWFDPPQDDLRVQRQEADWRAVQRGTVQHEILEGDQAAVFQDGDSLTIQVNCAAYAGALHNEVPYALAVSLEVAPELDVEVFTEVAERVRPMVAVRPTAGAS